MCNTGNHMHPIHINQNWYSVVLLMATNVRDPHLGNDTLQNTHNIIVLNHVMFMFRRGGLGNRVFSLVLFFVEP